jgi:hypothetical protein
MEPVAPAIGAAVGGRYLIERPAWTLPSGDVFVGRDDVLDRSVLVFALSGSDPADAARVAARVAQIHDAELLQVYDAGPGWIVCEHPRGGRLADRRLPLSLADAASATRSLARGLAALHDHGMAHGAVSEELVLFDEDGRVKLAGAGFAHEAAPADDVAALGRIAYRAFTGKAPGEPRAKTPPPQVALLLRRLLAEDPAVRPSPSEIQAVLEPYARIATPEARVGFLRQEWPWLTAVGLLIGLAVAAVLVGLRVDFGGGGFPIKVRRNPTTAAPAHVASVRDFDPLGDGEEHRQQAPRAADGDDLTAWYTVGYRTASLGGGKPGVGLVFDLGTSRTVAGIVVRTPLPGWRAEWRVADEDGASLGAFRPVASFSAESSGTTAVTPPSSGRYWLLWITSLVSSDTGTASAFPYQAAVAEVSFLPE